jgi:hypothetical protein
MICGAFNCHTGSNIVVGIANYNKRIGSYSSSFLIKASPSGEKGVVPPS